MPTRSREKCRLCAKLSAEQARQLHGTEGDGCWIPQRCHKRRTYYRHRDDYNRKRRQNYRTDTQDTTQIEEILPPASPAAVLYLYRQRVDAPIHALGAELWLGQEKKAAIAPVHCFGLTTGQIAAYLQQVLQVFSQKYGEGKRLDKFATHVELDPQTCLIRPCPLHPE